MARSIIAFIPGAGARRRELPGACRKDDGIGIGCGCGGLRRGGVGEGLDVELRGLQFLGQAGGGTGGCDVDNQNLRHEIAPVRKALVM
ncbi:MAG: hypothetical protein NT049_18515 [Planctomycetota bacterium]|nr:hypothetical protein [Planctomycetota bacterium]